MENIVKLVFQAVATGSGLSKMYGEVKALAKIDAETKRRNAQLDITNRMIKAELELQRARAVSH